MALTASPVLRERVVAFFDDLEQHPVFRNEYFEFLENSRWNRDTFDFHRANFFYRTEGTVKGIAAVCARAAATDDVETLTLFACILNEEAGDGDATHCHEFLMERAHNVHGSMEFGSVPLRVKESREDSLVLAETQMYRERTKELVGGSYLQMLGVAMALERHAEHMLRLCRTAFRNTREMLDESRFLNEVEIYFNVHVGDEGVEERHAADARRCVVNNVRTADDLDEIVYGATQTLNAQMEMWEAMYDHVSSIGDAGVR